MDGAASMTACQSFSTGATSGAWMAGDDPGALLHPPPEDALQEWIVSPRVNRSGVGNSDPALVEPAVAA